MASNKENAAWNGQQLKTILVTFRMRCTFRVHFIRLMFYYEIKRRQPAVSQTGQSIPLPFRQSISRCPVIARDETQKKNQMKNPKITKQNTVEVDS